MTKEDDMTGKRVAFRDAFLIHAPARRLARSRARNAHSNSDSDNKACDIAFLS